MTELHVLILSGTTRLKGKLSPFCCVLVLVSGVTNTLSVRVCVCARASVCVWKNLAGVTGARHHLLKGVVFAQTFYVYNIVIHLPRITF